LYQTFPSHVLVADCFLTWLTPYGKNRLIELEELFPAHLLACRQLILTKSLSHETLSTYAASLIHFTAFCDSIGISEDSRMPASKDLLSLFISVCGAGSVGKGCMKSCLARLELWHQLNGVKWNGKKMLTQTVKGVTAIAPDSSCHNK